MPLTKIPSGTEPTADWVYAGLIALATVVFLLLLPASFLEGYDYATMHAFYQAYLRDTIGTGNFPWWNPYTALGRPFFSDVETGCGYPFAYLVIPFGLKAGTVVIVGLAGCTFMVLRASSRTGRSLLALVLAGVLLASGDRLPVLGWLARHVPGFGAMRYPSRYGILVTTAYLVAGAAMLSHFDGGKARLGVRALALLQFIAIVAAAIGLASRYRIQLPAYWEADLRQDLVQQGFYPATGVPPRVAFDRGKIRANSGMAQGYSTLDGFANPMLRNVWNSIHREAGTPPPDFEVHELSSAIYGQNPFPVKSAALNAGWDSRAGSVSFHVQANRVQVLGLDRDSWLAGFAEIRSFSPNEIVISASAVRPGLLLLAEPAYPGWSATLNGRAATVKETNGWMRAVTLDAGENTVVFRYRPSYLGLGSVISLGAAAACLILWCRGRPQAIPAEKRTTDVASSATQVLHPF
jgi:hypothetical protein